MKFFLFSQLFAFIAALFFCYHLVKIAPALGLIDSPSSRKVHDTDIPLVGGLAMFLAFVLGLLTIDNSLHSLRGMFAGTLILVMVGTFDDLRELSSFSRFVVQIIAALFMVYWGDVLLVDLGQLTSNSLLELGIWSVPLTIFSVVGVINALNMSDGVDGLAGGISFIVLAILAIFAIEANDWQSANVLLLLLAVVLAFLCFNFRIPGRVRALLFMGDAGSMFLGFVIAWYLVKFSQGVDRLFPPVIALWILTIPLMDTVSIMFRRVIAGRSPFSADREHFHHAWLLSGYSTAYTVSVIMLSMLLMSGVGIFAWKNGVSEQLLFYGFLALFLLYFTYMAYAWRNRTFLYHAISSRKGDSESSDVNSRSENNGRTKG